MSSSSRDPAPRDEVALDDCVRTIRRLLAFRCDGVQDASPVDRIDSARDVALLDERVYESGDALFRDCKAKREIGLDRVAVPKVLQDPILRERHTGLFEHAFRAARESCNRVTERGLLDVVGPPSAMTIDPCRSGSPLPSSSLNATPT
jgi:hypothetical protein